MKSKLIELTEVLQDIELHDASLDTIILVINKSKGRIDNVLDKHHPADDEIVTGKLREISNHLGKALSALSDIHGRVKNG